MFYIRINSKVTQKRGFKHPWIGSLSVISTLLVTLLWMDLTNL